METFDIVFEAGGAKGIAFIGALEVLLRKHATRRLIGTSAGAITATCLAAGYSPKEMLEAAQEKRDDRPTFSTFLEPPKLEDFSREIREKSEFNRVVKESLDAGLKTPAMAKALKGLPGFVQAGVKGMLAELPKSMLEPLLSTRYFLQLFSLTEGGGLFTDGSFIEWIQEQLNKKGFTKTITLKAFHEKTGRDLSLAVADITDKELLLLNHRTAPQCPVYAAVRMSMSIPFVWPEVMWKKEWGQYRERPKAGNAIVDGSMLSNFPLRFLVNPDDKSVRAIMGQPEEKKARNLGLLLDETKPIPGNENAPVREQAKLPQRISRLVDAVTGTWDQEIINQYPDEICAISAKGVSVLEFDMEVERLQLVVNSGRCAMTEWLRKKKLAVD